jgi:hypothetical protein
VAAVSASQKRERAKVLQVRLSPEEHAKVAAAASASGLSLSGYARETLLGEPTLRTQRAAPTPEIKTLAALLGKLGMVGNNLNQLARLGNQGQPVPTLELSATLAAIRLAAEKVRQTLK